jgi:demethylmenaquinone methyltransferase/2-methoxy-6-polyprenyl-1,4-benzoquinol methylase
LTPDTPRVLDVAAGTAAVAMEAVRAGRARRVVALDQSEPMLAEGARRVSAANVTASVSFVLAKGERMPFAPESFDALTVTYLLRYVDDPAATLRELVMAVRPGGTVASLEFAVPTNPVWRACWWAYTRVVMPVIGRFHSRAWYRVGLFLGPSIDGFWARYPLEAQLAMWREAGVEPVHWRRMTLGGAIVIWGVRA